MAQTLQTLDALTWGARGGVARGRAGRTLREAADVVSRVIPVSSTTVRRLEDLTEVPAERRRRNVAFCTLLVYGFDPTSFGLSAEDAPAVLSLRGARDLLTESRTRASASGSNKLA